MGIEKFEGPYETMTFRIMNDENEEVECEVLLTFESNETGKNYIVYTDNTLDEEGNTKVYASIYDPLEPNTKLQPIETEEEWELIETILEELQNAAGSNNEGIDLDEVMAAINERIESMNGSDDDEDDFDLDSMFDIFTEKIKALLEEKP